MHQYKECGLAEAQLLNGYRINETPYGKSITITDVKGLHRSIGMELVCNSRLDSQLQRSRRQRKFEVSGNARVRQNIG